MKEKGRRRIDVFPENQTGLNPNALQNKANASPKAIYENRKEDLAWVISQTLASNVKNDA